MALVAALLAGLTPPTLRAQPTSPVFVDDSPLASDGLIRAGELAAMGNLDEAARVLQALLDTEADRLLPVDGDPDLFTTVRGRIHAVLLSRPALLSRYRALQSAAASALLREGDLKSLARSRFLTGAGFEAAMRLAQEQFESAQFHAARCTLEELDSHPDRTGEGARAASDLLMLVASYLGPATPVRTSEMLARWRGEAGQPPWSGQPAAIPSMDRVVSPLTPVGGTDLSELLPRPLWSDAVGERLPLDSTASFRNVPNPPRENALWLYAIPTAVGDTVLVCDSQTITAWNRFTLSRLWRARVEGVQGRRFAIGPSQNFEELVAVAADESYAAVLMGLAIHNTQTPKRSLMCLDRRTGAVVWERLLDDLGRDEAGEAIFRGPVMIDQGVVVVLVEKDINRRRLESAAALGLNARNGSVRWFTPLASSGSLAYGFRPSVLDAGVAHEGVVFLINRLGFIAAVESATGRTRWIRRWAGTLMTTSHPDQPWESNTPVLTPRGLFAVSPDRRDVILIDPLTGRLLERCQASKFDNPDYLLSAGGMIVGVSSTSLVAGEVESFGPSVSTTRVGRFQAGQIRGRALTFGEHIMVPLLDGVGVYDPRGDGQAVLKIPLDKPGNLLPLDGQLLAVDDREVHTYLVWDAAERMLRARMEEHPGDPAPAITYAELSFRAGRPEGILPAVDRALSSIAQSPLTPAAKEAQSRLFAAVFAMVEPGGEGGSGASLSLALRGALIERLNQCASSSAERVAYLLASARFHEATDQPARAVADCQAVLDSPDLASSLFRQGDTVVSADFEATRRLRRLVEVYGVRLYDAYQADADRRLADLQQSLDPEAFEAVARRYPVARASVSAWLESASRYASQGRPKLAAQALEEGLAASRFALAPADPLHGELTGRLVRHYLSIGLVHPAHDALEAFRREHPGVRITENGRLLEADALASTIRAEMEALDRRPRLGPEPTASSAMIGWALVAPIDEESPQAVADRALFVNEEGEVAMFRATGPGPLTRLWDGSEEEEFLWMDAGGATFARAVGDGDRADYVVLRRDLDTGRVLWETPPFRSLFPRAAIDELLADPTKEFIPVIDTPLEARIPVKTVSFLHDRGTMVLLDRLGRAAAFDLASGRLLWANPTTVPRMHDAALSAGTLLIGGADGPVDLDRPFADAHASDPMTGLVLSIDARTGQVLHRFETPSRVRWVRLAPEGFSVIGLDDAVVSLDGYRGRVRWRATAKSLALSQHAWPLPRRIIVRTDNNELIQVGSEDGSVRERPLDSRDRLGAGFGFVQATSLGGFTGVRTRVGLAVYDGAGQLVGLDARERDVAALFAAFADRFSVTVTSAPQPADEGSAAVHVNIYANPSLRIMSRTAVPLGGQTEPGPFHMLDGKLLITSGMITIVVDIPPTQ